MRKGIIMKTLSIVFLIALLFVIIQGCCKDDSNPLNNPEYSALPDIQQFRTNPSDRFLVDIPTIISGHPFKGRRANTPHIGAHTHWDNGLSTWPQGGTSPSNYPVIYAVADGYIERIDYKYPVGSTDRYGVDIAFARNSSEVFLFNYSIEPMVLEPSVDFYKQFIRVTLGQHVNKGDTIAYMYLPPTGGIGSHIHFHLQQIGRNNFLAPAIFDSSVVDSFYVRWAGFGMDGATAMPSCMGYMLDADENPYGTGPVDTLK
jgi:hypothetical protein